MSEEVNVPQEPEAQPETTDQSQEPKSVQDRIGQLTKFRREAERQRDQVSEQNAALAEQVAQLTQQVQSLSTPQPAPPPADDLSSLFGQSRAAQSVPQTPQGDLPSMIEAAVQKALTPMVESVSQAEQANILQTQQIRSFEEAARDFPEIRVEGSEAQLAFDELWQAKPSLQQDPDGPAFAIQALKGIFANSTPSEKRKVAATTPQPGNPQQRIADLPSDQSKEAGILNQLKQKINAGEALDDNELNAYYGLSLGTMKLKE